MGDALLDRVAPSTSVRGPAARVRSHPGVVLCLRRVRVPARSDKPTIGDESEGKQLGGMRTGTCPRACRAAGSACGSGSSVGNNGQPQATAAVKAGGKPRSPRRIGTECRQLLWQPACGRLARPALLGQTPWGPAPEPYALTGQAGACTCTCTSCGSRLPICTAP